MKGVFVNFATMNLISLIIPVYNRPQEVEELLESLVKQTDPRFEVVIAEDGSTLDSKGVVDRYRDRLDISYYAQPNGGPSSARNLGARHAKGDFFIFMDSDCLVPGGYFETVNRRVRQENIEFFGGADSAAPDFSPLQKAVSYSMTSIFTTGGIRGKKKSAGKYSPRSFNLGISRNLFERVGGFTDMRIGEDIDFSFRVLGTGAKAVFLEDATVCHKRRTGMRLFFKQVFIFGVARVNLNIRHPRTRRALFLLPALFTLGSAALVIAAMILAASGIPQGWWLLSPFVLLMALWFTDSAIRNRSLYIGWLSIWTSFMQLYGYGLGFLYGIWMRRIRKLTEKETYKVTRYFSQKTR